MKPIEVLIMKDDIKGMHEIKERDKRRIRVLKLFLKEERKENDQKATCGTLLDVDGIKDQAFKN